MKISLIFFVLILCSCKSKEISIATDTEKRFLGYITEVQQIVEADTTKTIKTEQTEEYIRITEDIKITEYDTEKQTIAKVTETKKVTEQGKQTKTDESEERGITSVQKDSIDNVVDYSLDEEVKDERKEESTFKGFLDNLGKWFGIGIAIVLVVVIIWKYVQYKLSS